MNKIANNDYINAAKYYLTSLESDLEKEEKRSKIIESMREIYKILIKKGKTEDIADLENSTYLIEKHQNTKTEEEKKRNLPKLISRIQKKYRITI